MTDPMSGGDATSRGHLNADDGAGGRNRTGPDIDAAGAGAEAPGGDIAEQAVSKSETEIGGSAEADAAEVGGSAPDYVLVRANPEVVRELVTRGAPVVVKRLVPHTDGTFDLVLAEWRP
jgi:hypothetical protein